MGPSEKQEPACVLAGSLREEKYERIWDYFVSGTPSFLRMTPIGQNLLKPN